MSRNFEQSFVVAVAVNARGGVDTRATKLTGPLRASD